VLLQLLNAGFEKEFQTKLILAKEGDTLTIPAGTHSILGTLSMDRKAHIFIRGAGIDKSILSFANQDAGAEGLKIINSENITLADFTIKDSKGDAIKIQETKGITLHSVKTSWSRGPHPENGSYGIYPVQCSNVLIDSCIAIGASDAGIYVGQSSDIIVKHSEALLNVAGIEIENSIYAEVFNNHAHGNTGGILIFDLPDLILKNGQDIRVYDNLVENNNLFNFAPPGNIVGTVPAGTGILVMGTRNVEIFNNRILNHKTVGTGIVSYHITGLDITDSLYNPYTSNIYIHDNYYERQKGFPSLKHELGRLFFFRFGRDIPDIIYDGNPDPQILSDDGNIKNGIDLCMQDNHGADFLNLDIKNNFTHWYTPLIARFSTEKSKFVCEVSSLTFPSPSP